MTHRQTRPRAIAIAAPAPYAGPGHLVLLAALAVLALLLFSNLTKAHAGDALPSADVFTLRTDLRQ